MSSPPSFSSAATRTSDHIHDSLYHQDVQNTPSLSDVRPFENSYSGNHTPIADQPPSFPALARDQGNSHKNSEAAPDYYNHGQPLTIGSIDNRTENSQASASGAYDGYDLPPSRNDVAPRKTSQTGTAADDQNLPPQPYGHNTPSLSDVQPFEKSYSGNHTPIADQPPSFPALARDQGNSHKNSEAAPDYYNHGQPLTIGSIDNRTDNSQVAAGAYDGYDLPPSRNDVAPRKTSQTGTAADDQNLPPQPYGQMSVIGRKMKKFEPPAYYTE